MAHNRLEKWGHVDRRDGEVERRDAGAPRGVDHRKVERVFGGLQRNEEIEDLAQHIVGARIGAIDFIDDNDRLELVLEGLAEHEARLRHRPLEGINDEDAAVGERKGALHLAAEVRVARRVDDVDLDPVPFDRGHLGENRDAALPFDGIAVHRAIRDVLVVAEGVGAAKERVDQGRFPVVDVGDDGDVSYRLDLHVGMGAVLGGRV